MRALVTGATGLVGSHLVRSLLRRGDTVRALARTESGTLDMRTRGAEIRFGDLGAPSDLGGITEGVDAVFHLASSVGGGADDLERVDVRGTAWLLAEARRSGVGRFVYPGTLSAYPPRSTGAVIDETSPLDSTG
ncbi:MAG: NAD-dependent epimerase/dehydratase family protein, partial [Terriglobales bacterium]